MGRLTLQEWLNRNTLNYECEASTAWMIIRGRSWCIREGLQVLRVSMNLTIQADCLGAIYYLRLILHPESLAIPSSTSIS